MAHLEAGGRQSPGTGASKVPSRIHSLCAFSGPPGCQCRPLPPRSGPPPQAAAPSPAPPPHLPLRTWADPLHLPSTKPSLSQGLGWAPYHFLREPVSDSCTYRSRHPTPVTSLTGHSLKPECLFVYLLSKKLTCAFMSVRSWFVLFTVLV